MALTIQSITNFKESTNQTQPTAENPTPKKTYVCIIDGNFIITNEPTPEALLEGLNSGRLKMDVTKKGTALYTYEGGVKSLDNLKGFIAPRQTTLQLLKGDAKLAAELKAARTAVAADF